MRFRAIPFSLGDSIINQDLITIRQSLITLGQEIVSFRSTQVAECLEATSHKVASLVARSLSQLKKLVDSLLATLWGSQDQSQVALAKSKVEEYSSAYQRIQAVFAKHCLG